MWPGGHAAQFGGVLRDGRWVPVSPPRGTPPRVLARCKGFLSSSNVPGRGSHPSSHGKLDTQPRPAVVPARNRASRLPLRRAAHPTTDRRRGHGIPQADPHLARLRRRRRDLARCRTRPQRPPRQHGAAQARGPPVGVLVQDPWRLQHDGEAEPTGPRRRGHRGVRRQPRAGGRPRGIRARLPRRHRHADDHTTSQGGRRARRRRRGRPARRLLLRRRGARRGPRPRARPDDGAPVRRPRRHRRAGHHRHGDPAPGHRPPGCRVRRRRRWRAHLRHRGLRQGAAPGRQGHRGADRRLRRHGPIARGRAPGRARARRAVLRRHRGASGGGGDLPARERVRRRDDPRRHGCRVRGDQGRLHRHPRHPRTRWGPRRRRAQGVRRPPRLGRRHLRRRGLRRQHGLRPPALRRRAGRDR
jgi:hypothetical protein